ncbi:pro-neuregulin-1, membrane-bound isoform [Gadus chalcogrammus]|uniref:pro-neuregulin-1, membrane-bound isoform n=1 Tax=Gadus chalcogrammus TaxID=1042646 RepID=UPI0024C48DC8|nr:pro-neuregulin-1, membrane-bound isoform [Gadus chalcogrammus]
MDICTVHVHIGMVHVHISPVHISTVQRGPTQTKSERASRRFSLRLQLESQRQPFIAGVTVKAVAPTLPSLRSEVFKPCVEDKDLAFCLNDGECSIIETRAGVHRHCRCKEGYHGLRCDQFVPKTDAILSDPTDELGIEFMESAETYQRQMLSILSISLGICLLGVACMALYRRNKGHREKLRSQFSESRSLRGCSFAPPSVMPKSSPRLQYGPQQQKWSHPRTSVVKVGGGVVPVLPPPLASPALTRALAKVKRFRSSSLSISPAQECRGGNNCQIPPTSRGKRSLLDGARVSGRAYSHLDEAEVMRSEFMDQEAESLRRCGSAGGGAGGPLGRPSLSPFSSRRGWTEVPCTRLETGAAVRPASLRTRSVSIIPSLQAPPPGGEEGGEALPDGALLSSPAGSKHKARPSAPAAAPWSQGRMDAAGRATQCGRPRPQRPGRAPTALGPARPRGEEGHAGEGRASREQGGTGPGSVTRGAWREGPHAS